MNATGVLAPLRHRPFVFLAAGGVINRLGGSMAPIALAFAVLDLTGSVSDLGIVVGARSLTSVAFLLFGGVVADRLPRNLVLVASGLAAALTQAVVAGLVLTETATIGWLAALSAVNGLVASFAFPAAAALMGQTVPESIRRQANALSRLGMNGAMIGGASVGGVLVAAVGPGWGLAADAASFAIAACCFALVRVPETRAATQPRRGAVRELREGWREFAARRWLWVVVIGFCFSNAAVTAAVQVLGPAVADQEIGRRGWGAVLAAETLGMVVGGLFALRLRPRRLLLFGVVACAAEVLLPLTLAIKPAFLVLVAAALLTGVGLEQFAVAWDTSMQEHVPSDLLARVYAWDALGSMLAIPLGQVAAGPAALALGNRNTLLIAAGVIAVATIGMVADRSVRGLQHAVATSSETKAETVPAALVVGET